MSIDSAIVRRIARLARIGVEDAELERFVGELNSILGWVDQLSEVDIEGVAPMIGVEQVALRLRPDMVTDAGLVEEVLGNAPEREGVFYAVPKVVE